MVRKGSNHPLAVGFTVCSLIFGGYYGLFSGEKVGDVRGRNGKNRPCISKGEKCERCSCPLPIHQGYRRKRQGMRSYS